jgi:hypothetical protein
MSSKDKNCALCGAVAEKEEPAILALGNYGYPRYLCDECEAELDAATLGKDFEEVSGAIERLAKKTDIFGKDDKITLKTMKEILEASAKRANEIKEGSYDFALDEKEPEEDEEGFDEIPEELRESDEDRARDEKEAKFNKKLDKITNWIWVVVFAGLAVFFVLRFMGII